MKVMVTYISPGGSTRKIAEAIFGEIKEEKDIKPMGEIKNLEVYDLVFVGFSMHGFGCPEEAREFTGEIMKRIKG